MQLLPVTELVVLLPMLTGRIAHPIDIVRVNRPGVDAGRPWLHADRLGDGGYGVPGVAAGAVQPDVPWRAAGGLPGPVLLEVVLFGLEAAVGEDDKEADEAVEDSVDEDASVKGSVWFVSGPRGGR